MLNPKFIYKVILAGDSEVGKSTFLNSILAQKYIPEEKITVGVDFECFSVDLPHAQLNILIFDLGAQLHFQFMHKAFVLGGKAGIILYDLTRPETFDNLLHWIELLQSEYPSIPLLIAGSKQDLVSEFVQRQFQQRWEEYKTHLPANVNILGHHMFTSMNTQQCNAVFEPIRQIAIQWREKAGPNSTHSIESNS